MSKQQFLKLLDKFFGTAICSVISRPVKTPDSSAIRKILLIRPGGIGDAVLLIPAITLLRKKYPDSCIDILAENRNASVFSLNPYINSVFLYDAPRDLFKTIGTPYDVVIDTEQWHRLSAIVARLIRAPETIGFETNNRKKLFTCKIPYSHDEYEVRSFLNLVSPLTGHLTEEVHPPFLTVPALEVLNIYSMLNPIKERQIITIFPGASIPERKWGIDKFHRMAERMHEQGYSIAVVGGPGEREAGEKITAGLINSANFCGSLSLPQTAAVLQQSALLISGDSGIMHIGYGLGIKVLALFGPGRELKWAPQGESSRVLNKQLECSPCTVFGYTKRCERNAECMARISVEDVFAAAMSMLKM